MSSAPVFEVEHEHGRAVVASSNTDFRKRTLETLRSASWLAEEALGGAEALEKVEAGACSLLLLDCRLPDLDVDELIEIIKARHSHVDMFLMDSERMQPPIPQLPLRYPSTRQLLQVLQNLRKLPAQEHELGSEPRRARERAMPPAPPAQIEPLAGMIGTSERMASVYRLARLVSRRDTTVLLTGETGTGKELVAQAIHQLGPRSAHPFVVVNCAAIPEALFEAELFGYARGAFTGAFQSQLGRIRAADGGTLFLDEVGDLPLSIQVKLLRFLQEGEVQRLGSPGLFRVNARVIAATNSDLTQRIAEKQFREDLYYRLSVFPIELPPLRERAEDIIPLAEHFLFSLSRRADVPFKSLIARACGRLQQYSWPGNVRELQHMVERAFILADGEFFLLPEHFSPVLRGG